MKKSIVGVVVGAVAYFMWGFFSWAVLPWHMQTMKTLPEETLISDTLKTVIPESGIYAFPSHVVEGQKLDDQAFTERYTKGPTGLLIFSVGGKPPMNASSFLIGIATALIVSSLGMFLLSAARARVSTVLQRALLMAVVGLAVVFSAHVPYWNWLGFPLHFTVVASLDSLVTFFILGLVQAPFAPKA